MFNVKKNIKFLFVSAFRRHLVINSQLVCILL